MSEPMTEGRLEFLENWGRDVAMLQGLLVTGGVVQELAADDRRLRAELAALRQRFNYVDREGLNIAKTSVRVAEERDRLRAELAAAKDTVASEARQILELRAELAATRAEVERYRETLNRIARSDPHGDAGYAAYQALNPEPAS